MNLRHNRREADYSTGLLALLQEKKINHFINRPRMAMNHHMTVASVRPILKMKTNYNPHEKAQTKSLRWLTVNTHTIKKIITIYYRTNSCTIFPK